MLLFHTNDSINSNSEGDFAFILIDWKANAITHKEALKMRKFPQNY